MSTGETQDFTDVEGNISKYTSTYNFTNPFLALNYITEFMKLNSENLKSNYTQGCKWAPDGNCFQVASDDSTIKLFNLPSNVAKGEFSDENWIMEGWKSDIKPALTITEKENIYDFKWYPLMQSHDPSTSCFAVTCREQPIHLWDAWTGQLICSYLYFDHLEQLCAAYSLGFNSNGTKLAGGYAKGIQVYDVERHGKCSTNVSSKGQSGIISCIDFHPQLPNIFAAGSYDGSVGIYSLESNKAFALFQGHTKGVTHLQFTSDGTKLLSGTRKDDEIICWDIRNPGQVLCVFIRNLTTNQRMYFDISPSNDQYLLTGTTDGDVLVWDIEESVNASSKSCDGTALPTSSFTAHENCVNGISIHPFLPLLVTSCGQRIVPSVELSSDSEDEDEAKMIKKETPYENSVKLWWIGNI